MKLHEHVSMFAHLGFHSDFKPTSVACLGLTPCTHPQKTLPWWYLVLCNFCRCLARAGLCIWICPWPDATSTSNTCGRPNRPNDANANASHRAKALFQKEICHFSIAVKSCLRLKHCICHFPRWFCAKTAFFAILMKCSPPHWWLDIDQVRILLEALFCSPRAWIKSLFRNKELLSQLSGVGSIKLGC